MTVVVSTENNIYFIVSVFIDCSMSVNIVMQNLYLSKKPQAFEFPPWNRHGLQPTSSKIDGIGSVVFFFRSAARFSDASGRKDCNATEGGDGDGENCRGVFGVTFLGCLPLGISAVVLSDELDSESDDESDSNWGEGTNSTSLADTILVVVLGASFSEE